MPWPSEKTCVLTPTRPLAVFETPGTCFCFCARSVTTIMPASQVLERRWRTGKGLAWAR